MPIPAGIPLSPGILCGMPARMPGPPHISSQKWWGAEGKVYAFEPDEYNYRILIQNLELHKAKCNTASLCAGRFQRQRGISGGRTMAAGIRDYLVSPTRARQRCCRLLVLPMRVES